MVRHECTVTDGWVLRHAVPVDEAVAWAHRIHDRVVIDDFWIPVGGDLAGVRTVPTKDDIPNGEIVQKPYDPDVHAEIAGDDHATEHILDMTAPATPDKRTLGGLDR